MWKSNDKLCGEMSTAMLFLVAVLFGAIFLSYGVHSIYNSKHNCMTIEESFNVYKLEGCYANDEAAYATKSYYKKIKKIRKLFMTSKEYYYLVKPENGEHWITVRATEDWGKQFDSITGEAIKDVKIAGDYWIMDEDVKQKLSEFAAANSLQDVVRNDYYIDNFSEYTNVYRLVFSAACFVMVFFTLFTRFRHRTQIYVDDGGEHWLNVIVNVVCIIIAFVCFFKGNLLI